MSPLYLYKRERSLIVVSEDVPRRSNTNSETTMKKLTLDLDALRVETFDTSPTSRGQRGTVKGHASDRNCPTYDYPTLEQSCMLGSCHGSCDSCDYSCMPGDCTIGTGGTGTVYDPSCGGTCNGGVTCFDSICVDF